MTETSLEQVVAEREFLPVLQVHSEVFFRLANTLLASTSGAWTKKHYFQLINECEALESFLDDYGARYNRTYCILTELVASTRWFALAGYSISHMQSRIDSYGIQASLGATEAAANRSAAETAARFLRRSAGALVDALVAEARRLRVALTSEAFPEENFLPVISRRRLPRNVNEEELSDERQKIAEVASKYLQACDLMRGLGVRVVADAEERRRYLRDACSEERARVYEATVHNLQSTYDTYIKNTVIESQDRRLPQLRGLASASLHLLEAVTYLTHFYERHEADIRSESTRKKIAGLVDRDDVQDLILNNLLLRACTLLEAGRRLAEALLPEYTNAQELVVELAGDLVLHARPAALIVGIVNHFGTPVEMEVAGARCNAASILELLVTVGSHPDEKRFVFRGDAAPLTDISLLFRYGLGERGIENLPVELSYLRSN
jgi:phosphotransferase system HPr-like phosphotransfer protein